LLTLLDLPDEIFDRLVLDMRLGDEVRVFGTQRIASRRIEELLFELRVHGEHLADALRNGLLLLVFGGLELLERLRDGAMILLQQLHRVRCGRVATAAALAAGGSAAAALRAAAAGGGAPGVARGACAGAQRAWMIAAAPGAFAAARAAGRAGAGLRLSW